VILGRVELGTDAAGPAYGNRPRQQSSEIGRRAFPFRSKAGDHSRPTETLDQQGDVGAGLLVPHFGPRAKDPDPAVRRGVRAFGHVAPR
jgi:hypothetical protein